MQRLGASTQGAIGIGGGGGGGLSTALCGGIVAAYGEANDEGC